MMPFDTFILELAFFSCSLKILASLPTESHFHSWHDTSSSYGISQNYQPYQPPVLGRHDHRADTRGFSAFARENFNGNREDSGFSSIGSPQSKWYHFEQRPKNSHSSRRHLPVQTSSGFEGGGPSSHRSSSANGYLGVETHGSADVIVPSIRSLCSSHENCEAENQKNDEEKSKSLRENIEPIFGSEASRNKNDGRINFENSSKDFRTGNSRESEVVNSRIVTPKIRRPPQRSPAKNQNKPFGPGATNTISSTEKNFSNQTAKGPKGSRPRPQEGDIVFPDGYSKKFIPRVVKCAKKSTFCEHVGEEYPGEYITQVMKKEGAIFKEFFGKDLISDPNITERINVPEENSLCPYRQGIIFPKIAQNKEEKWLFVVNQDQYMQGVTVEVCLETESRCILTENFPLGYTPYCKQKYVERRMVAIGEDGKPTSDFFKIPSCCACVVKLDSSARMGLIRSRSGLSHH